MKAKEIENKLKSGCKLIHKHNNYFDDWYFIDSVEIKNRLREDQFLKYKAQCSNKDESQSQINFIRGQSYYHYYWI